MRCKLAAFCQAKCSSVLFANVVFKMLNLIFYLHEPCFTLETRLERLGHIIVVFIFVNFIYSCEDFPSSFAFSAPLGQD